MTGSHPSSTVHISPLCISLTDKPPTEKLRAINPELDPMLVSCKPKPKLKTDAYIASNSDVNVNVNANAKFDTMFTQKKADKGKGKVTNNPDEGPAARVHY